MALDALSRKEKALHGIVGMLAANNGEYHSVGLYPNPLICLGEPVGGAVYEDAWVSCFHFRITLMLTHGDGEDCGWYVVYD